MGCSHTSVRRWTSNYSHDKIKMSWHCIGKSSRNKSFAMKLSHAGEWASYIFSASNYLLHLHASNRIRTYTNHYSQDKWPMAIQFEFGIKGFINRFSKFVLIMATDKYIQSVHFISLAIKVTPTFIVDTFAVCFLASHLSLIVLYEILCKVLFRDCQEPIMFYLGIIVFPIDYEYAQISYLLYLDVHRA